MISDRFGAALTITFHLSPFTYSECIFLSLNSETLQKYLCRENFLFLREYFWRKEFEADFENKKGKRIIKPVCRKKRKMMKLGDGNFF